MIPIRLLGFDGETVLNSTSDHPPLEVRRLQPPRVEVTYNPELTALPEPPRVERYRAAFMLTEEDGGPLVIYHRVE